MKSDSSGYIKAGSLALMYLIIFIPRYLISTFLQVRIRKNTEQ